MEPITWDTIRLTLHVLAATIWVGGQITLAALVPAVRRTSAEATRAAAHRFAAVGWPAYGVLVLTGMWNVSVEWDESDSEWRTTLVVKLVLVGISGIAAYVHQRARSTVVLATFGALSAIAAVSAVLFGVLLGAHH